MVEQTFSISSAWSIDPPCYVRKVDRSGHCKDAATIRDKVFCLDPDESTISVYLVASATDLARVAIALNANRSSKTEPLFLLAMTGAELAKIAVSTDAWLDLVHVGKSLAPRFAGRRRNSIGGLAETLVAAGRKQHKFTERAMQEARTATTRDGCRAAHLNSVGCACEDELPKSRLPLWLRQLGPTLRSMFARFESLAREDNDPYLITERLPACLVFAERFQPRLPRNHSDAVGLILELIVGFHLANVLLRKTALPPPTRV